MERDFTGGAVESVYLPRLLDARLDVFESGVAIPCRRHDEEGSRRNAGQDLVEVIRDPARFIDEEAQPGNEPMEMGIGSDAFGPLIGGIHTHRSKTADRYHSGDTLVDGGCVEGDRGAQGVTGGVDSFGVDAFPIGEHQDCRACIGDHLAHFRPVGVFAIEVRAFLNT